MSEKNKATLLKGNAAIMEGNNEGFLALCTEDTQWTFVGDRTLNGKEAVRRYMAKAYIEPPKFTVENLVAEGDYLIATGEITLKNEDGNEVHHAYCDVWRFRGDQIAGLQGFVIEITG